MNAITAFESSQADIADSILITTVEPCLMCMARIFYSMVKRVIFVQADPTTSIQKILDSLPPNLAQLSQRVTVSQFNEDPELVNLSRELYQAGEELWEKAYRLE